MFLGGPFLTASDRVSCYFRENRWSLKSALYMYIAQNFWTHPSGIWAILFRKMWNSPFGKLTLFWWLIPWWIFQSRASPSTSPVLALQNLAGTLRSVLETWELNDLLVSRKIWYMYQKGAKVKTTDSVNSFCRFKQRPQQYLHQKYDSLLDTPALIIFPPFLLPVYMRSTVVLKSKSRSQQVNKVCWTNVKTNKQCSLRWLNKCWDTKSINIML